MIVIIVGAATHMVKDSTATPKVEDPRTARSLQPHAHLVRTSHSTEQRRFHLVQRPLKPYTVETIETERG
jgi:hypothetical protein